MLPKFLLADNSQESPETIYVVHNEEPRFIVESDIEDFEKNQKVHWIDAKPESKEVIAALLEDAEDFLEAELDYQDILLGEDDDEDEDY
ncbi:MAG: hypothetical protein ACK5IJ_07805 [Mangrovibacterium sp.]